MKIRSSISGGMDRVVQAGLALIVAGLILGAMLVGMQDVWAAPQGRTAPEAGVAQEGRVAQQAVEAIIDCDTITDWSPLYSTSVSTDTDRKEGDASIHVDSNGSAPFWGEYDPSGVWDLSEQDDVIFWFEDVATNTLSLVLEDSNREQRLYTFTSGTTWQIETVDFSEHLTSTRDGSGIFDWSQVDQLYFGDPSEATSFWLDYIFIGDGTPVDLVITKTSEADSVMPGHFLTYTVKVSNMGVQTATGVVVTDTLPLSTTLLRPDDWNHVVGTRHYTRSLDPLGPDVTDTLTVTVQLSDTVPAGREVITNQVAVADDGTHFTDNNPEDNEASLGTSLDAAPDLQISKTSPFTQVAPGQLLTYTITITNAGDQDATNVVVTDTLPVSLTYQEGGWDPAVGSTTVHTYGVGHLAAIDGVELLTLTAWVTETALAGEIITNHVEVAAAGVGPVTDTDETTVEALPGLAVSKTDDEETVAPGGTLTYTIVVTNTGNQELTDVVVTDTVSSWVAFVGPTSWQEAGGDTHTRTLSTLAAGYTEMLTLTVHVTDTALAGETITNGVEVAAPDVGPVTDTDETTVEAVPGLAVTKTDGEETAVPGATLTYSIVVTNTGNEDLTDVVVTDTVSSWVEVGDPWDWQEVGADTYTRMLSSLAAGYTETLTLTVQVVDTALANQIITNEVEVVAAGVGPMEATDETTVQAVPGLAVTKTDGLDVVAPGKTLTYTIVVSNTGNQELTNVVVTDTLSSWVDVEGPTSWQAAGADTYTRTLSLAAGYTETLTLTAQVTDTALAGETITNTVEVAAPGVGPVADTDETTVQAVPGLAVTKTDGLDVVAPGETLRYTIVVSNTGNQELTNVVLTDTLSSWVDVEGPTSWQAAGADTYTRTLSLAAGYTETLTLTVQVTDTALAGETITNTVEAAAADVGPVGDTDETTVEAVPGLAVTKTDDEDTVAPGGTLTYTIVVTNTGNQDLTDVVVTDTVPLSTSVTSPLGSGGWQLSSSRVYTYGVGTLVADQEETLTLTVEVEEAVSVGTVLTNEVEASAIGVASVGDTDLTTVEEPSLAISKRGHADVVAPGAMVTYTIAITNSGGLGATGVVVTDTLPVSLTYQGEGWDPVAGSTHVYTYAVGDLTGDGGVELLTLTAWVTETALAGEIITNRVEVADDGDAYAVATDDTTVGAVPALAVSKTDGADLVLAGDTLTYTIVVTNTGNEDLTGVVVTETVAVSTTVIGPLGTGAWQLVSGRVYTYGVAALAVDQEETLTLTVEVAEAAAAGQKITNKVEVSGDGVPAAQDTDMTIVQGLPGIDVSPGVVDILLRQGETAEETLTLENLGDAELNWTLDEIPEVDWLSATPISGTVAVEASEVLTVSFDPSGLKRGATYTTTLAISSDDPEEPLVEVSVSLTVISEIYLPLVARRYDPACVDLIENGGFERNTGWTIPMTEYPAGYTSEERHSGSRSMRVGIVERSDNRRSYSSADQTVTLPEEGPSVTLRFQLLPFSREPVAAGARAAPPSGLGVQGIQLVDDLQYVLLLTEDDEVLGGPLVWQRSNARQWRAYTFDLSEAPYAGKTVRLVFGAYNDGSDDVTGMYVDDVSLQVCGDVP